MISNEELGKLYLELLPDTVNFIEASKKLKETKNENIDDLRKIFCNELLDTISKGYTKYNQLEFAEDSLINIYLENVKLLPERYAYFHFTYYFFTKQNKKCIEKLKEFLDFSYNEYLEKKNSDSSYKDIEFFNEGSIIDCFFEPFKEAFDGFWTTLADILRNYLITDGIPELCEIIGNYYKCKTDSEALEMLLEAMIKYPDIILIKELIGYTYYSMKLWNNAIAYFENVEDTSIFFREEDLYFLMAWCYGKIKSYKLEEKYYKKSLEIAPNNIDTLNNLGYCVFKQKRFQEAMPYFEKCLEKNKDYIYSSNNYLRVLIALGRNKDAKDFVKTGKYKISQELIKRVKKLDNTNARLKKNIHVDEDIEIQEENITQKSIIDLGIKRQQFSNEKLLEDELVARIESGVDVFGINLKMYKRKGVYGRQFIIPIGRLDLLCEDEDGNLYIIELKKDSGYDDAYKQTVEYLDWFEKNEISAGKKVYGIICLNSPTKELVEKVHKDKRIRLFEYQISYTEL